MKFAELRQGDVLLSLEQDRRGFPYCDMAQIQRISAPTTGRIGNEGHYQQIVDMTVSDSMGTYKITVQQMQKKAFMNVSTIRPIHVLLCRK